jgi:hypothetical protein
MDKTKWEVVYKASGMIYARIVEGRLTAEGIPTKLQYEAVGAIYAITVDGLGEVKVMVPPEYVTMAEAVLARSYDDEDLEWETEHDT